jgi:WD40 repeat protein
MTPTFENRELLLQSIDEAIKSYPFCVYAKTNFSKAVDFIKKDTNKDSLSISENKPTLVSYINNKKKVETTLNRYLKRKANLNVTDSLLESFCTTVTGKILEKTKRFDEIIKVLSGTDILDFYIKADKKTFSCMTGARNTEKIRMYAINPDKIQLATCDDIGRALLWTADDGTKILDYAYPNGSQYAMNLINWAKNKGYLYVEGGKYLTEKPIIEITVKTTGDKYPRLDKFYFATLDEKNKTAVLRNRKTIDTNVLMNNTNGNYYKA